MNTHEMQRYIVRRLCDGGFDPAEAASCARILLAHKLEVELAQLPLEHRRELDRELAEPEIGRLLAGEPLQYIIGQTQFMGLTMKCTPSALIPRGDSESVTEAAIEMIKDAPSPHIADICTGCGTYALSLAYFLPHARIDAVDISAEALELAASNADRLGVNNNIRFFCGDLLEPLLKQGERYDMIVSNPPYIPSNELDELPAAVRHEPAIALDGGADGLFFYRRLEAD